MRQILTWSSHHSEVGSGIGAADGPLKGGPGLRATGAATRTRQPHLFSQGGDEMSPLKALRARANGQVQVHPVDEILPIGKLFTLGMQHMLAAYAGIIAPPFIIGTALHLPTSDLIFLISASLLASGVTTLLQTLGIWKVGVRLPLVQGVSFSGIASMIAIGKGNPNGVVAMQVIVGAVIVAAAAMFFLAPVYSKLLRFFPPLVMGSVVTVIGVSLIPISIGWLQGDQ
ncbi:MAG TPA: solute carrier family 23 protein, partial [Microbacterium sp.]|uniref:solute carrier family 23 protein n=1 Tax=Microbacterium sp. TaxID=51671 RepID=UPI002B49415C